MFLFCQCLYKLSGGVLAWLYGAGVDLHMAQLRRRDRRVRSESWQPYMHEVFHKWPRQKKKTEQDIQINSFSPTCGVMSQIMHVRSRDPDIRRRPQ